MRAAHNSISSIELIRVVHTEIMNNIIVYQLEKLIDKYHTVVMFNTEHWVARPSVFFFFFYFIV